MLKKIVLLLMLVMTFGVVKSQTTANEGMELRSKDVVVVYDKSEVAEKTHGKRMTETIKTSLNFGTKSKVKKNCLEQLKKQAAKNGYSVLYIDEEASEVKKFNKRGVEVTLVGIGYKG